MYRIRDYKFSSFKSVGDLHKSNYAILENDIYAGLGIKYCPHIPFDDEYFILKELDHRQVPKAYDYGKEAMLNRIIDNLNLAIDIPFFFNGDSNKFYWESNQIELQDDKERDLLEPFQYIGTHFRAIDETYDLRFEFDVISDVTPVKIYKFPIIAYAFTDEGYKKIYQGINVNLLFKFDRSFEFQLRLKIF
ncbi:hypothetical protein LCGC14_1969820 [marine sediment metagenome]|uniref:Uncharacterized protein n=1 Tax=marine sediment metagenome TaxID=412755 RepID=A0A0F9FC46_9ZZZZ